jgi:radical SAM superfamily enzyme YgiQ (UPF0313 family)
MLPDGVDRMIHSRPKLVLVIPKPTGFSFYFDSPYLVKYWGYAPPAPLVAPLTLAGLTPDDWDTKVLMDKGDPIDYVEEATLAAISIPCSSLALRAYRIADAFRKHHVKVVLGGVHPTFLPEEASRHADAVVLGEAEEIWNEVLQDASSGNLKSIYRSKGPADLSRCATPRWDLLDDQKIMNYVVQCSRGCPHECDFCSVTALLGRKIRLKKLSRILDEVKTIADRGKGTIFFSDDNFLALPGRFLDTLLDEVKKHRIRWYTQTSVDLVLKRRERLRQMADAGCKIVFLGLESLDRSALEAMRKRQNLGIDYGEVIRRIRSAGIIPWVGFIVGNDEDRDETFEEIERFVERHNITHLNVGIAVPFPGTEFYGRLEREGRLFERNWDLYDGGHLCFQPKNFTPQEFEKKFVALYQRIFALDRSYGRLCRLWRQGHHVKRLPIHKRTAFLAKLLRRCEADPKIVRFVSRISPWVLFRHASPASIVYAISMYDFAYKRLSEYYPWHDAKRRPDPAEALQRYSSETS